MPELTKPMRNATLLLGLMTTEAGSDGTFSAKREDMARRLGWSDATFGRALKQLRDLQEVAAVTPGGGAGRPTAYHVSRLARKHVAPCGAGSPFADHSPLTNRNSGRRDKDETTHSEHLQEGAHRRGSPGDLTKTDFLALGENHVEFVAGFARRVYELWSTQPPVFRFVTAVPAASWAGWGIARKTCGKKLALLGAIIGAEVALLASFVRPTPGQVGGSLFAAAKSCPTGTYHDVAGPRVEHGADEPRTVPTGANPDEESLQHVFDGLASVLPKG